MTTAPRRRNSRSHAAILEATVELLEEGGFGALTVEGVAARAGVGKQTIYRWWGGDLAALVLEAYVGASDERVPEPDLGDVRSDLLAIVLPVVRLSGDPQAGTGLANKTLMAQAQLDRDFQATYVGLHRQWHGPLRSVLRRGVERGELRAGADPQLLIDTLLGAMWYRLLLEHAPLDEAFARDLVDGLLDGVRT